MKEKIAYLKLWLGIFVVIDTSLIGWLLAKLRKGEATTLSSAMALAMKQDVAFNPIEVSLFGADAVMLEPEASARKSRGLGVIGLRSKEPWELSSNIGKRR